MPQIASAATSLGDEPHGHAGPVPQTLDATRAAPGLSRLRTYIVEDSPVIRENLIATLEELTPVKVVGTADDESTAVLWLAQPGNRVDLVIVDIFLKEGSGLGVLRAGGALAQPHKMVVLSNYATPDMRHKCQALGADRVFDKSHDIDSLIRYCCRLAAGELGNTGPGTLS